MKMQLFKAESKYESYDIVRINQALPSAVLITRDTARLSVEGWRGKG